MAKTELDLIVKAKDEASSILGSIGGAVGKLAAFGVGAGIAGVAALGAGIASSIGAAMEAQDGLAELQAVIASTGGAAGVTADFAQELASSLQNVTRFSDDAILAGESMLLTFTNIGRDVFPEATEAMLNMAEKFGSVEAASVQLGKALNDPVEGVTALRRVGVMLTDAQEEQIARFMELGDIASAQRVILAELGTEFGGLAQAAGGTFGGQLDILKNKFGDVQEQIGGAFLPLLTLLADKLQTFASSPAVQEWIDGITAGIAGLTEVITPLAEGEAALALQNFQALLLKTGFSPEQVEGISGNITSIVEDAQRIGEAFGKIFSSENNEGASSFAIVLDGIAWSMERIAAAAETASQLKEIFSTLGGAGGVDAIVNEATGFNMNPVQNIAAADQFLKSDQMSRQGLMNAGGAGMLANVATGGLSGIGQGMGFDVNALVNQMANTLGPAIASALQSAPPPPPAQVTVQLDSDPIAARVQQRIGTQAAGLRRVGGAAGL